MSVVSTLLTQGGSTVDGVSFASASVAPSADSLLVLVVGSGHGGGEASNSAPSSISGLGLTWSNVGTVVNEYIRLNIYTASIGGSAPTPGTITVNYPSNMHACHWHVVEATGATASPVGQYKTWLGTDQNPSWSFDSAPAGDSIAIVAGMVTSDTTAMGSSSGLSMLGAKVSTLDGGGSSAVYIGDPAPTTVGFTTGAAAPRKIGFAIELLAASTNQAPVAVANVSSSSVAAGEEVSLLGGSSSDPDGSIADYNWTQTSGPTVNLVGTGPTRIFIAPALSSDTALGFSLVVTDDQAQASTVDTVQVTVGRNKAWLGLPSGGRAPLLHRRMRGVQVDISALASEDGSGTATLYWVINPGGQNVQGVYAGRDGQSSTGGGPYESALTPGLSGERVFDNLIIGETYNLYIDVQVDGARIDRWSVAVTPQGVTTPPVDGLEGWTLLYQTEFDTLSGWNIRNETQSNDNSRNISANCVPGAIAVGKGLIIHGKRESGYNRPYTSGEIDGAGTAALHVPSYFRAEIIGSHMQVAGLWPALLWYRPIGTNDGEIDVHEYMGGNSWTLSRQRYAVTMHNEYGATQDSSKKPIYLDQLSNQDVTALRKFVIEKTPGQIKVILDDEIERVFSAADKTWWNRIMESGHAWYPRITLQIGDGGVNGGKTVVPEPPAGWNQSEMRIHSYKAWEYTP